MGQPVIAIRWPSADEHGCAVDGLAHRGGQYDSEPVVVAPLPTIGTTYALPREGYVPVLPPHKSISPVLPPEPPGFTPVRYDARPVRSSPAANRRHPGASSAFPAVDRAHSAHIAISLPARSEL